MTEDKTKNEKNELGENQEEWHHVVTMEDLGNLRRKIHILYDQEAVRMALDKSCEIIKKRSSVKGFRRGKAPRQLVEVYYKEEIEKSASSMLTQEGFLHACFEKKIQPLGEPKVENAEFNINGSFSCDIILEVKPTIEPTGYVGLQLVKKRVDREKILKMVIEDAKNNHIVEEPIDSVVHDSVAVISFDLTSKDGEKISSGSDHQFLIKKGQDPPIGENLIGKSIGDDFTETTVMPEHMGFGNDPMTTHIVVNRVFKRILPSEEKLVELMQAPSYDKLMESFSNHAEQEAINKEVQALEEEIVTKLLEANLFEIPEGWVESEEKYLSSQLGLNAVDEDTKRYVNEVAERNVRRTFILDAIYDAEPNLKLTKEELDAWIEKEAKNKQVSTVVLKKDLQEQGLVDGVVGMIRNRKVLDFILQQANIVEENQNVVAESNSDEIPENPFEE